MTDLEIIKLAVAQRMMEEFKAVDLMDASMRNAAVGVTRLALECINEIYTTDQGDRR